MLQELRVYQDKDGKKWREVFLAIHKATYTYITISSPYYALFLGYVALTCKCAEEGAGCG